MSRRGENIYKRKDGRWEGRILRQNGKYQYLYAKSYREVKEKMKYFHENKVEKKQFKNLSKASELFDLWLKGDVSHQVKPSTYESYHSCMHKYVIPFFQKNENAQITVDSVRAFVRLIRENTSIGEASRKKILTIFKIALKEILKDLPMSHSILELVQFPKIEEKEVQVFSMKEQRMIEHAALNREDKRAIGIVLCFYTGIRLGELCALKWSDIDTESGTMSITRTVSRTRNFEDGKNKTVLFVGTPKSKKSMRRILLPTFLLKVVRENRIGYINENHYIFSGKNVPMDPRYYQKLFKRMLLESKIPERKFHAIRHTFATRALELGVDIKTLSEILGHSNVSITLNVYAHSLMEHKRAAIDKFNTIYLMNKDKASFTVNSTVQKVSNI